MITPTTLAPLLQCFFTQRLMQHDGVQSLFLDEGEAGHGSPFEAHHGNESPNSVDVGRVLILFVSHFEDVLVRR